MEKRNNDKKVYKPFYKILGVAFFVIPLVFMVLCLVMPDKGFSEKENRTLSKHPDGGLVKALAEKENSAYEQYVNDQFVFRDSWISLKAGVDIVLGKRESNGVWYCDDDYLMEAFAAPSEEKLSSMLNAIKDFKANNPDLKEYFLLAPNAVNILEDKMPTGAPETDQNIYIDRVKNEVSAVGINFIDVRNALRGHKDEQLYYKTDHHWTTLGAYYAYKAASAELALSGTEPEYESLLVTEDFQGTLSAKSGFRSGMTEEINVFVPTEATAFEYVVNYIEERDRTASFFKTEMLETRDKYALFFGGNHSQIRIYTPSAPNRNLLIFKDSYANSFIPFLAPHFSKIIVIDPRYYYGNVQNLIAAESITEILYLVNANTFFADSSLEITLGGK